MSCKACHSLQQRNFPSEISMHFPGFKNLATPPVLVFPSLLVCLDCGFTEFSLEEWELVRLREGDAAQAGTSQAYGT